jgi:2-dehydropantoate 2-reductase
MKIAIFGTGAVGGYFGGRLAQAGHDVTFIARGAHLQAIQSEGLKVNSIKGDFSVHPAQATDRPETIGAVDVILCENFMNNAGQW